MPTQTRWSSPAASGPLLIGVPGRLGPDHADVYAVLRGDTDGRGGIAGTHTYMKPPRSAFDLHFIHGLFPDIHCLCPGLRMQPPPADRHFTLKGHYRDCKDAQRHRRTQNGSLAS